MADKAAADAIKDLDSANVRVDAAAFKNHGGADAAVNVLEAQSHPYLLAHIRAMCDACGVVFSRFTGSREGFSISAGHGKPWSACHTVTRT